MTIPMCAIALPLLVDLRPRINHTSRARGAHTMANAEIVAIGSELLLGQIVDTNSTWLAQRLTALGINLFYKTVVGDNPGRMKEVLTQALERSDVVITSGGLGPTQDDLTREVVAEVTGRKLVLRSEEHTSELQSRSDLVCRLLL